MSGEKQKTILLVEDEAIISMTEKMTLEKYGYKVITAYTGEEAVALAEKSPGIDLILMDINLGAGIDGTEAAMIILNQRDLPVVFLSSHMEPEVVAKTEKITSYGYVVKASSGTVLDASIKMAFKLFEAITKEQEKQSQMEAALKALQESEQRLNSHVDNSPLAAIEWTSDFILTRWSDEAEKIFGWNRSETIGKSMMDLKMIYDEDIPLVQKMMERLSDGSLKRVVSTNRNYTKEGKVIVCEWYNSVLLNPQGEMISVMSQGMDITDRKHAESQREASLKALKVSEVRSQALLRAIPDMLFRVNRQGVYLDYKADVKDLFDQSETTLIGRHYREHVPAAFADLLDLKLRATLESGAPQNFEYRLTVPGLGERDYEARSVVSGDDEVTAIIRDITERKRAEQELIESRLLIDAVVESVPLMIFLKEATDLRFVIFNRAGEELLGYDRKALLGKNDLDFFPPEQAAHFMAKDREVLDGESGMLDIPEEPILTAKKGARLLHTRKVCIQGADGKTKYLLGISEDITERKQAEEEIKRQLMEKEILLKEVHHRIKNNIASIGGLLSLRLQSITNPEAIAVLQEAIGRVDSIRILYDKLLLSKGYEDISVKNYVESLADGIVALFPGNANVTVEKRITDFHLDPKRLFPLGLIINELITNKMKYAFIGRESGKIKISLTKVDKQVKLILEDNGIGLPDDFDINESKGFGLMLVKMLSQQLGGSFSMGKKAGTRCTVEFNI